MMICSFFFSQIKLNFKISGCKHKDDLRNKETGMPNMQLIKFGMNLNEFAFSCRAIILHERIVKKKMSTHFLLCRFYTPYIRRGCFEWRNVPFGK